MNKRRMIMVSLAVVCGLIQMPAGDAQVTQLITAGIKILPQLIRPLTQKLHSNNGQGNGPGYGQTNVNGQGNDQGDGQANSQANVQANGLQRRGHHKHKHNQNNAQQLGYNDPNVSQPAANNSNSAGGNQSYAIQSMHGSMTGNQAQRGAINGQQASNQPEQPVDNNAPFVMMSSP